MGIVVMHSGAWISPQCRHAREVRSIPVELAACQWGHEQLIVNKLTASISCSWLVLYASSSHSSFVYMSFQLGLSAEIDH